HTGAPNRHKPARCVCCNASGGSCPAPGPARGFAEARQDLGCSRFDASPRALCLYTATTVCARFLFVKLTLRTPSFGLLLLVGRLWAEPPYGPQDICHDRLGSRVLVSISFVALGVIATFEGEGAVPLKPVPGGRGGVLFPVIV